MQCPRCGAEQPDSNRFCSVCGNRLAAPEPVNAASRPAPALPPQPPPASASAAPQPFYSAHSLPPGETERAVESKASTAMLIEVVGGVLGFLGLGNIYAGRANTGIIYLVAWWIFIAIEVALMIVLVGICLTPLNLIVPIYSGLRVRDYVRAARIY